MNGWIKLHRSLIEWEWYDDINVKVTFIHLLLSANHSDKKWRGIDIGRGQLWISISNLSKEIGLSEKQIRNCLKKLQITNEISIKGASKGTMITVCKYDSYQSFEKDEGEQTDKRGTNEGQAKGEQRATNNNDNNYKNEEELKEHGNKPPSIEDVIEYFEEKGYTKESAIKMFNYYEESRKPRGRVWKDGRGNTVKNWKQKAQSVWFKPDNEKGKQEYDFKNFDNVEYP
jgi:predicted transcriptional regulator